MYERMSSIEKSIAAIKFADHEMQNVSLNCITICCTWALPVSCIAVLYSYKPTVKCLFRESTGRLVLLQIEPIVAKDYVNYH